MSTGVSHLKPITVRARQTVDGASKPGVPNAIPPGLYESIHGSGVSTHARPLPPLAYFCIRSLLNYADQVHGLGSHRIRSQPEVLLALSPSTFGGLDAATRCLCKLDPRLWSILVQVYSDLPKGLQNYYIPLGDRYLPLLQAIPSTPSFALITVLSLVGCVSDETSHALKSLHGLCALDISQTSISHLGIRHFAPTVTSGPPDPRYGTRGLRILRLCNCPKITDQVVGAVSNFSLLAILGSCNFFISCYQTTHANIDLRGTGCTHDLGSGFFRPSNKGQRDLFQCSLQDALQQLRDSDSRNVLFSHPDPFVIKISTEFHPDWPQRPNRPKPASDVSASFPEMSRAAASSSTVSIYEQFHHQDSNIMEPERELRKWICSMLGDAGNETRISELTDFVTQRWEYDPEWLDSSGRYDSDSRYPSEEDDSIDSWDEDRSTVPRVNFCGYEVDEGLVEEVREMVEDAWEEHESTRRFYGLDSRAPKAVICHCKKLRGTTTSPAETTPVNRHLMLVRDPPPPWGSVYGPDAPQPRRIRLATKPSLSDSSNLNPDQTSMWAKKSAQEMLGMITQRKSFPTTAISPSLSSAPTVSTNPFRKDSSNGLARGGLRDLQRRHANPIQGGSSDSVPTPKRMKSISQIPVPPKPIILQKAKSSGIVSKRPGKLKQTTLLGVFGKRT